MRPSLDGTYTVGRTRTARLDLIPAAFAHFRAFLPQLRDVPAVEDWGGMIDVTPDEVPTIGPVAGLEGLTLASGLSGHGFGFGPGAGLLAAQLATGRAPAADPAPFATDRFDRP